MPERLSTSHSPWKQINKAGTRLAAAAALAVLFIVIAVLEETEFTQWIDDAVRVRMYDIRGGFLNAVFPVLTQLAAAPFIIGTIVVLLVIPATRKSFGIPMAVFQSVYYVFYRILKTCFARPRPDSAMWLVTEHGFSFPSGHSMNGMVFFGLLAFLVLRTVKDGKLKRWLAGVLMIMPYIMAFTRLYLGVHYLSDVLAGLAAGACEVILAGLVLDYLAVVKAGDSAENIRRGRRID